MTEQRKKKPITGVVLLALSLACALAFAIISATYPAEMESDPDGLLSFSGVDLYAFVKTAAMFFGVAVLCLLGAFLGVMSSLSGIPSPLRLSGVCATLINAGSLLVHIFKHGEFLLAMIKALEL